MQGKTSEGHCAPAVPWSCARLGGFQVHLVRLMEGALAFENIGTPVPPQRSSSQPWPRRVGLAAGGWPVRHVTARSQGEGGLHLVIGDTGAALQVRNMYGMYVLTSMITCRWRMRFAIYLRVPRARQSRLALLRVVCAPSPTRELSSASLDHGGAAPESTPIPPQNEHLPNCGVWRSRRPCSPANRGS
jgi:hypothetical protein